MPVQIAYHSDNKGKIPEIPEKCKKALCDIADLCQRKGVEVLFFKAPVSTWTKEQSKAASAFFDAYGLEYLEMNDHLEEMSIDPDADFYNEGHLNTKGAEKATVFMARFLMEHYGLGKSSDKMALQQ